MELPPRTHSHINKPRCLQRRCLWPSPCLNFNLLILFHLCTTHTCDMHFYLLFSPLLSFLFLFAPLLTHHTQAPRTNKPRRGGWFVISVKSHIKVYRLYNEFNSTQVFPYHRLFRNFIYNYHIRCIAGESVHINGLTYTHKQAIRLAAWHRYTTFLLFLEWNIALFTQDGTLHQYFHISHA